MVLLYEVGRCREMLIRQRWVESRKESVGEKDVVLSRAGLGSRAGKSQQQDFFGGKMVIAHAGRHASAKGKGKVKGSEAGWRCG